MNIREIAKLAGVSSATISRVLNNSENVNEKTREKVLDIIKKHKFVPNAIARSLSMNDSFSIAVIIPDIENEFFAKVISGISEVSDEYKYNLILFGSNENIDKEHEFLKIVESHRIKGLIITPVSENDEITKEALLKLKEKGVNVVLLDRSVKGISLDGVFVDNEAGAYEAVSELIRCGHKKIAIIRGPESSRPGKDRYKGYKKALAEHGIELIREYIKEGDFKVHKAYKSMKELMSLKNPPTAIFTSNNLTTLGCIKYTTENKMTLGKDIAIIGFDDIDTLKMIDYKISVVNRDEVEQGKEAMKMLYNLMNKEENSESPLQIILPHELILRGSEKINKK